MMTPDELTALRPRLLAERARLVKLLKGVESEIADLESAPPVEWLEQAQMEGHRAVLTDLDEQERRTLDEIERALGRMEIGTYGVCELCGREIEPARLFATPRVPVCIQCQTVRERLGIGKRQERIRLASMKG
jgi:DnaK suppressor protein